MMNMMKQVYKSFPNDIPITSICIVEDPSKCPPGHNIVLKTHDQDSDADLWREVSFFGRRISRYLCYSKMEKVDHIIQFLTVVRDKENPPEGFSHIAKTVDGDSKAWRKKQLVCKYVWRSSANSAISDIILLSKTKIAPPGFNLAGDINGLTVCFKLTSLKKEPLPSPLSETSKTANTPSPVSNGYPQLPRQIASPSSTNGGDYVNVIPCKPYRPAPLPPTSPPNRVPSSYSTIEGYSGIDGVHFAINPRILDSQSNISDSIPKIKARTAEELDNEYQYDFRLETSLSQST